MPDLSRDTTFHFSGAVSVFDLEVLANGQILVGGNFFDLFGITGLSGVLRLHPDGTIDTTFLADAGAVEDILVQDDGRLLIAGGMGQVGGVLVNGVARLEADGSLDTAFLAGPGLFGFRWVGWYGKTLALQADAQILLGGTFAGYNGVGRNFILRMNGDLATSVLTGESAHGTQELIVYPNPTDEGLWMELPHPQPGTLAVMNAQGALVRTERTFGGRYYLELADQPTGMYILHWTSVGGEMRYARIVRQ